MRLTSEFTVAAPAASVYETLLDFERVGACVPGAKVGPAGSGGEHPAEIAVRLGPIRLTYRGTVRLEERAESERRATLVADVRDVRGQGTARARMSMAVSDHGPGSHVMSTTEVQLSGRAAQMGAGIVEEVAARLVDDVAKNLEQMLATGGDLSAEATASDTPLVGATAPAVARAPATQAANRPIGGFRLLLRTFWHRLLHRRRSPASDNP